MKVRRKKWHLDHVEWGEYLPGKFQYYFYWFNFNGKGNKFFGLCTFYDGQYYKAFGLWWISLHWTTQWTKCGCH